MQATKPYGGFDSYIKAAILFVVTRENLGGSSSQ